jgi:NAD(P)-dependent dehydrogenase (short-subunit alcohol dehydrogenase family)
MPHPAIAPNNVAVITGAASGIGLAAAHRLAALGLKVCLADLPGDALERARAEVEEANPRTTVSAFGLDVAQRGEVEALAAHVADTLGPVHVLINNAGIEGGGAVLGGHPDRWRRVVDVNLFGPLNGVQVFAPAMLAHGQDAVIVNTGSKQGITSPPGDNAYNVSKAGLKVLTETLAHELRNTAGAKVTAHLLIPGFTFTGFTRAKGATEKPAGAWTGEQVVDFMLERLEAGDFYILCPDDETPRELDAKRILWAAGDIVENRPALSRWHPDWGEAFKATLKG